MTDFHTEQELRRFIERNIPLGVKPTRKVKYMFVQVFKTAHAKKDALDHLAKKLWEKLKE